MKSSINDRVQKLAAVDQFLEIPMLILSFVWAALLVVELTNGLSAFQETVVTTIWVAFILEFLLKFTLAPSKMNFLRTHILESIALLVPALRVFRLARVLSILRASRAVSSTRVLRAFTSSSRLVKELKDIEGQSPEPEVNVGILLYTSEADQKEILSDFTREVLSEVRKEMESVSNLPWKFHIDAPIVLNSSVPKTPTDFVDEATRKMVEGPFDMIVVVTDSALYSRQKRVKTGFVSAVGRISLVSTHELLITPRGKGPRSYQDENVKANAGLLLLHQFGRMAGLKVSDSQVMSAYHFNPQLLHVPHYNPSEAEYLKTFSDGFPEREYKKRSVIGRFLFHVIMVLKHPMPIARGLWQNQALFLALNLPSLATAAVAPAILLVFTAEIWDVGLGMTNMVASLFTVSIIILSTLYLTKYKTLFFPRKDKRILTEHLAVANGLIFLSVFLALLGLFLMVMTMMIVIEFWVFPPDLINTWPTLEHVRTGTTDLIRLAAFISSIGVATGSLGGSFESRVVLQNLALFENEPE